MQIGTKLGAYEIIAKLGEGGMGEVYRARDARLQRDVAIKVLPELFAADPERLARFEREAQVLASISHPNIAGIYGVEEQSGIRALVLELVDGETLAELIEKQTPEAESLRSRPRGSEAQAPRGGGPPSPGSKEPGLGERGRSGRGGPAPRKLDIDDALSIATQIAEALEAAHEQGIIHRDLKPANVKVTPDGAVKVLDFGLAKLTEPAVNSPPTSGGGLLSHSPTITSPVMMTGAGIILGTAAYMSPEQAKGRPADKRSDIWAFGCVLYELLTGKRAFEGEDLSDVLATVLKSEPDWAALPASVPAHIRTLVQRCLVKDRRHRLTSMSVALFVLGDGGHIPDAAAPAGLPNIPASPWRRAALPMAAVVLTTAVVGPLTWLATRSDPPPLPVTRFTFSPTGRAALVVDNQSRDLAVTADGSRIIYKGLGEGAETSLFVRTKDQLEPTPLTRLGNPRAPFVSPDGQWIGFVQPSPIALNNVSITGGAPISLCRLDGASRGATWGSDGNIVFATTLPTTGLQRVSSDGGEPTVLTKPDPERGEADHLYPQFLPGGQALLFTITAMNGGLEAAQVAVLDLSGSGSASPKVLIRGGSQAQYVPSGHLVYSVAGTLRAVAFDLERLEVVGSAVPVQSDVVTLPNGTAEFDISKDGTLVYLSGAARTAPQRTLVWVNRQGHEEPVVGAPRRAYVYPRISPDGAQVALDIRDQDNDIWVWDLVRQTLTRATFNPGLDESPVWMPDGRRLIYTAASGGATVGLFWQAADGTGAPELLTQSSFPRRASGVSPDGASVLFWEGGGQGAMDVSALELGAGRAVKVLLQTPFIEKNAVVSPDGRWLAYDSNDSGEFQISVRPYPDVNAGRWQVSSDGGTRPLWSRNGRELFYLAPDGAPMAVSVSTGGSWAAGTPSRLFAWPHHSGSGSSPGRTYDVSPDARRFLIIKDEAADKSGASPTIVVVENWGAELKRLVPVGR